MRQLNGHRRAVSLQVLFVLLLSGAIAHAQPNLFRDAGVRPSLGRTAGLPTKLS